VTIDQIRDLWDLAGVIHRARRDLTWGPNRTDKEPWPKWHRSYTHNPIAYADLALAAAESITNHFKIDIVPTTDGLEDLR
jgi:hypothetical protein